MNTLLILAGISGAVLFMKKNEKNNVTMVPFTLPERATPYLPLITKAEKKYGLPNTLLARIANIESAYKKDIIVGETKSKAGAMGIMQIVPRWHPNVDPLNPVDAIPYAANYLKQNFDQFGSWPRAVAAYNWGPGNLKLYLANTDTRKLPEETENYLLKIFGSKTV
jgi:soluble lytic murein transglycosylase-like protein